MRLGLQIAIIVSLFACVMTVIGYVLLVQWNKPATSTTETAELIRTSTPIILFGIFIFIVMAGTMTFLIRSVTNPVKKLRDAADKITRGNLDVQPNIKGTTEVRDLVISFNTMVNTLKKAKELQSAAVAKYKNLYENAPGLYRTVSVDGIIADCNKSFAEHLGYTVEEVIGTHYNKYTDPKDVEAMTHSIDKISENALRLQRLIGDVMLAQRLEIGQMNFDKQKFEVTKLMSEIHNDYSKIMNEKQIEFVNSTQENLSLWSDKNRVREVID